MVRQLVRRHRSGIIHAADDDGRIGIAFEKLDDHLVPDARDMDRTPVLSGPRGSHAQPARAVRIRLAPAIPRELHFHAAIFVRENFLPRRPDDHGGLRAHHARLRRRALRAERQRVGDAGEAVGIDKFAVIPAAIGIAAMRGVMHGGEDVFPLGIKVFFQRELVAGCELVAVRSALDQQTRHRLRLHPQLRGPRAVRLDFSKLAVLSTATLGNPVETLRKFPRVVVNLELVVATRFQLVRDLSDGDARKRFFLRLKIVVRLLE